LAAQRERGGEIQGGGRLSDSSFLVCDGNDFHVAHRGPDGSALSPDEVTLAIKTAASREIITRTGPTCL
jgi:hypothetical protein